MRSLIRRTSFWMMIVAGALMCLMMLHITLDVFLKYAFNQPFFGTVEIVSYYYMIGAVFLPLAYVQVRNQHISVDLLFERFPDWGKRAADAFALVCAIVLYGILAWQGWLDGLKALRIDEIVMGSATIYIWPARFFLPIAFSLVCLVSVLRLIDEAILGKPAPVVAPPIAD